MSGIRVALSVIGVAYALLGLVVVLFAVNLRQRVDISTAYLAVGLLAWGGTIAATGLSAGSVLGTLALVRHPDTRRPQYVLAILSGLGRCAGAWLACLGVLDSFVPPKGGRLTSACSWRALQLKRKIA
jgi:ABC-type polysaccharide/polyol phosphate export permease